MDDAIDDLVVSLFKARPSLIFMHDNALPHTPHVTTQHLNYLGIPVLSLPFRYSDLNLMQYLWDELLRRLWARSALPTNLRESRAALTGAWLATPWR